MATKIVTKNSSTASAVPTASDLVQGELAVNVADKRLFTEDNAGAIVELGTNPSTLTVTGEITANGGIALGDNDKATFGASDDLQIYHDGSNSWIQDAGTGVLALKTDGAGISMLTSTGDTLFQANRDSDVRLYYDNSLKLATTSTGIDVTGTATMDGLTVDGNVGIGTNSPTSSSGYGTLSINGTTGGQLAFQTGGSAKQFIFSTSTDLSIYNQEAGNIKFVTNNAEAMRIDSSGNVGIGASSPVNYSGYTTTTIGGTSGGILTFTSGGTQNSYFAGEAGGLVISAEGARYTKFHTNGVERMRIDSSGNVGIGNTVASSMNAGANQLVVGSGSTGQGITLYSSTSTAGSIHFADGTSGSEAYRGQLVYNHNGDYMAMLTAATERMRIDSSGDLIKVGGVIKGERGTAAAPPYTFSDDTDTGMFNISNADLGFSVGGSERMRISSAGSLMVNSTTNFGKFVVENGGNSYPSWFRNTSSSIDYPNRIMSNYATGGQTATMLQFLNASSAAVGAIKSTASATSYNTSSDQRLKENIADADDAGSKIDAIQVRKYDWKADGSHQDYGMIAQELQTVAPEAVSGDADSEEMMGVDYSKLVPMLIKEIQSLRNRVAQLEE